MNREAELVGGYHDGRIVKVHSKFPEPHMEVVCGDGTVVVYALHGFRKEDKRWVYRVVR